LVAVILLPLPLFLCCHIVTTDSITLHQHCCYSCHHHHSYIIVVPYYTIAIAAALFLLHHSCFVTIAKVSFLQLPSPLHCICCCSCHHHYSQVISLLLPHSFCCNMVVSLPSYLCGIIATAAFTFALSCHIVAVANCVATCHCHCHHHVIIGINTLLLGLLSFLAINCIIFNYQLLIMIMLSLTTVSLEEWKLHSKQRLLLSCI